MSAPIWQWAESERLGRLPIAPLKRKVQAYSGRVLVYVPMAPSTPKVYGRTITSLFRMNWSQSCEIVFGREDNPVQDKYHNLCDKYNWARQMALNGGYTALLTVEADMIVPEDTLTKLSAVDADVAYGLYVNRHGWHRWLAFKHVKGFVGDSYSQDLEGAKAVWGQVAETPGIGLGCTLIHRRVLEAIEFRPEPRNLVACDWLFAQDCRERGFKQAHHFGVVCGHIAGDDNCIYWPDPTAERLYRVEFIGEPPVQILKPGEQVTVHINGMGSKHILAQRVDDTPQAEAVPKERNPGYWRVPSYWRLPLKEGSE